MNKRFNNFNHNVILFAVFSFLGWLIETIYCYLYYGKVIDRGFLTLPLCPIYGLSIMTIYLLLGTHKEGGLILGKCKNGVLRKAVYFPATASIPTIVELVTGFFFHKAFGIRLWNYTNRKYNLGGYICLSFSLLWGVLISAVMLFIFPKLKKLVDRIPAAASQFAVLILLIVIGVDLTYCVIKLIY